MSKSVVTADLLVLASEYLQVREVAAKSAKRREELKALLKQSLIDFDANVALIDQVVVGEERLVPTPCEQTVVDADGLRDLISQDLWEAITVTYEVLDMEAYQAARTVGQIPSGVVKSVEATSTVWQLRTFTNLPKRPVKKGL